MPIHLTAFSNYQKISDITETTITDGNNLTKFDGDGLVFKGKLIGIEDLSIDRDEKLCLDSMFKLKSIVRIRGEHKQKIQLNLTINAIKVYDESTKVQIASLETNRISFVIHDSYDIRAFGYVYNTNDGRHQFWAIKTERPATIIVMALKELFDIVFKLKNSENAKAQANQIISTSISPVESTVPIQQLSSESTSVFTLQSPISPPKSVSQSAQAPTTPLFDNIWGDTPSTTVPQPLQTSQQQSISDTDVWGINISTVPVIQPTPRVEDPLADAFGLLASPSIATTTTQQSSSTIDTGDLFSVFTITAPTHTIDTHVFVQPTQHTSFVPQQQQPNFLNSTTVSSITSPTVTSPFGEVDLLDGFSSESTTKEFFFPPPPPTRAVRQMQQKP